MSKKRDVIIERINAMIAAAAEIYDALPAEAQRGVMDTLKAIIRNIKE